MTPSLTFSLLCDSNRLLKAKQIAGWDDHISTILKNDRKKRRQSDRKILQLIDRCAILFGFRRSKSALRPHLIHAKMQALSISR